MGMDFESKKRVKKESVDIAKFKEEQAAILAANTERIKDLQNIMADMIEGSEAK
ncbi:MAG: hypothetical protein J6M62_06445 [Selenomonadaceae bacterium]|nr:hypothetical protein [Selenomonadaceae bacterium]MBP3722368.1 hypothetical protein [Selenomonadaceae bacterium]